MLYNMMPYQESIFTVTYNMQCQESGGDLQRRPSPAASPPLLASSSQPSSENIPDNIIRKDTAIVFHLIVLYRILFSFQKCKKQLYKDMKNLLLHLLSAVSETQIVSDSLLFSDQKHDFYLLLF